MEVQDSAEVSLLAVSILEFRYIRQPLLIWCVSLKIAAEQVLGDVLRRGACVLLFFLRMTDWTRASLMSRRIRLWLMGLFVSRLSWIVCRR